MKYQNMPDITGEKWEEFKRDIQANGIKVAVLYDEDGNILDGHQRVRACEELGIAEFPKEVRTGLSEKAKYVLAMSLNYHRRQLTPQQQHEINKQAEADYQRRKADGEKVSREQVAREWKTSRSGMDRAAKKTASLTQNAANLTESKDKAGLYEVRIGATNGLLRMRAYPGKVYITQGPWLTQELVEKVNAQKFTDLDELKLFVKNHKPEELKPEDLKPEDLKPEEDRFEKLNKEWTDEWTDEWLKRMIERAESKKKPASENEEFRKIRDNIFEAQKAIIHFNDIAEIVTLISENETFYEMLKVGYKILIKENHPDSKKTGNPEKAKELNEVWNIIKKFRKGELDD